MKIYRFNVTDAFVHAYLVDGASDFSRRTSGGKEIDPLELSPLRLRCLEDEADLRTRIAGDFIGFDSDGLLMNSGTKALLREMLNGCGAWIECDLEGEVMHYFHVTKVIDALDEDLSDFEEFEGYVVGIKKYVFRPIKYDDSPIFRVTFNPRLSPFVTEEFVRIVTANDLVGLEFTEVFCPIPN